MNIPVIRGVIDRRILINYRIDPECLQRLLPAPLEPKLVRGVAIGGICLIRLREIRPRFVPRGVGLRSENAAHRFAVEWGPPENRQQGVFIPRRDTSSRLNALVGGRLFPGVHHYSRFRIHETDQLLEVAVESGRGDMLLEVRARCAECLTPTSVFGSLAEASRFFQDGSLGYSPSRSAATLDSLVLHTFTWSVSPLEVDSVHSAYFADRERFPQGTVEFDSALLMREIEHEWRTSKPLRVAAFAT